MFDFAMDQVARAFEKNPNQMMSMKHMETQFVLLLLIYDKMMAILQLNKINVWPWKCLLDMKGFYN